MNNLTFITKKPLTYCLWLLGSTLLTLLSVKHVIPTSLTEVFGFISGALCVWLTVKEHILNWPIGIINSVFFFVLFYHARLYASMLLQIVYIVLGFLGWYWWLKGGENKTTLKISKITKKHALVLAVITVAATYFMTIRLQHAADAAPFWDGITTVLSLVAQYMLTRKLLENWWVWIIADVIFVGLYVAQHLYLTAVLYVVFLLMCVAGIVQWQKCLKKITKTNKEV